MRTEAKRRGSCAALAAFKAADGREDKDWAPSV
jgi:hypothetical protein